jgi:hypothetical protein
MDFFCTTQNDHYQAKLETNRNKLNYKQTSTTTSNSLRKYGKVTIQTFRVRERHKKEATT